jgi:hypothetical protein
MKKAIVVTMILVVTAATFATASPAWAGSRSRHVWQGVAIGLGAAVLGQALFQAHHHAHACAPPPPAPVYAPPPPPPSGHWESRRSWVPPVRERVWNPGHYTPRGRWVPEGWIEVEKQPGYWVEERVWIAHP